MSEAICERPPDSRTIAVLGGLESTGKAPTRPARTQPAPTPAKSRLDIVGLLGVGRERGCHRRRLHDADHGDHQGQRHQLAQCIDIGEGRQGDDRQLGRQGAEHRDAAGVEMEQGDGQARRDETDQRARERGG